MINRRLGGRTYECVLQISSAVNESTVVALNGRLINQLLVSGASFAKLKL